MRKEVEPVQVGNLPELLRIAEEVRDTKQPRLLMHESEAVAIITPVNPVRRMRKSGILTKKDSFWNIVGIAQGEGPTDVSENKHKYLAEAYSAPTR